jgi:hypothetical protein
MWLRGATLPGNRRLVERELVALLREGVADDRPVDRASPDPHRGFGKGIWIVPVRRVAPGHLVVVEDVVRYQVPKALVSRT